MRCGVELVEVVVDELVVELDGVVVVQVLVVVEVDEQVEVVALVLVAGLGVASLLARPGSREPSHLRRPGPAGLDP